MGIKHFRGDAPPTAQVDTLTIGGTVEADDIFKVTINGKTVQAAAGAATAAAAATALYTALAASTIPEFAEITWANPSSGVITATGADDGTPFTLTVSTTEAGGGAADDQAFGRTATTAPTGPNYWSEAKNWSDGSIPANSDEVDLINCETDILYGLDQNGVTLARLTRHASFKGKVGLPDINETDANATYREYRDKELKISVTRLDIHESTAGRFRINLGSVQAAATIFGTGDSDESDAGIGAVQLRGTHASNVVEVYKGTVDIAMGSGEAATCNPLRIGWVDSQENDAVVRCGAGCTLTSVEKDGGELHTYGAVTAGRQAAGEWHHYDGAFSAPTFQGGTLYYRSDDDLDSPVFSGGAILDFTKDLSPREVVSAAFHGQAGIRDPFRTVTWTNGIDLVRRGIGDNIDLGQNLNIATANV